MSEKGKHWGGRKKEKKSLVYIFKTTRISIDCEKSSKKKEETAQYLDNEARLMLLGEYHQKNLIRGQGYILDNNNSQGWIKVHVKIG